MKMIMNPYESGAYEDLHKMNENDIERFLLDDTAERAKLWLDKDIEAEMEKYRTKHADKIRVISSSDEEVEVQVKPKTTKRATKSTRGRAKKT